MYREFYKPTSRILHNEFSSILDDDDDRYDNVESKIDYVSAPFRLRSTVGAFKAGEIMDGTVEGLVTIADISNIDLNPYAETAYDVVSALDNLGSTASTPFVLADIAFTSADLFNDAYSIVQNVVLQPESNAHFVGMEVFDAFYRECGDRPDVNRALGVSVSTAGSDAEYLQRAGRAKASALYGWWRWRSVFSRDKYDVIVGQTLTGVVSTGVQIQRAVGSSTRTAERGASSPSGAAPPPPRDLTIAPGLWTRSDHVWAAWRYQEGADDAVAVWYSYDAPTSPTDGVRLPLPFNNPLSLRLPSEGTTGLHVWLEDASGNRTHQNRAYVPIRYDGTAPDVSITSPDGPLFETDARTVDVSGSASDATSGLRTLAWFSSPSGAAGFLSSSRSTWEASDVPLVSGENRVAIVAVDQAGNLGIDTLRVVSTAASNDYTLDVSTSGDGSVQIDPDLERYPDGTQVSLTAIPGDGYTFSGWSGDASGRQSPLAVTMDADKSITARFTQGREQNSVTVIIQPAAAVNAGAQWQYRDGSWHESGETYTFSIVSGASADVKINFREIDGWTPPRSVRFFLPYGESRTVVSDPYIEDEAPVASSGRLVGTNGLELDYFGTHVAVEGNIAVVATGNHGKVHFFQRGVEGWIEIARRESSDVPDARGGIGDDIAMSDGYVAAGDINYGSTSERSPGAVHLFRQGAGWQHIETLTASGAPRLFGSVVAMDGRLLAGTIVRNGTPPAADVGAVAVFGRRDDGSWYEQYRLHPPDPDASSRFGSALSVSDSVIAVGARGHTGVPGGSGAVHLFRMGPAETWSLEQTVLTGVEEDEFARDDGQVFVHGDLLAVGAPRATFGTVASAGAVYLYRYQGGEAGWVHEATLSAPGGRERDGFGQSVAIGDDLVVVGAPYRDDVGVSSGATYSFRYTGGEWVSRGRVDGPSEAVDGSRFGASVALDGDRVLVGAPGTYMNHQDQGAAFVYDIPFNSPPSAVSITYPSNELMLNLEGEENQTLPVTWSASSDGEGDALTYVWKLSASADELNAPMLASEPDAATSYLLTYGQLASVLDQLGVKDDGSVTLFHRVDVTDGVNVAQGTVHSLTVTRNMTTPREQVPTAFAFRGVHPNPTTGTVRLSFDLPELTTVTLHVFDTLGRRVRHISDYALAAGAEQRIEVDSAELAAGVYVALIEFRGGNAPVITRFTVVR